MISMLGNFRTPDFSQSLNLTDHYSISPNRAFIGTGKRIELLRAFYPRMSSHGVMPMVRESLIQLGLAVFIVGTLAILYVGSIALMAAPLWPT
jgi:hypothetical protein